MSSSKIVITAIPKSASDRYSECVSSMMNMKKATYSIDDTSINHVEFRLLDGVIKKHYAPTNHNVYVLNKDNIKYIILIRHPLDMMVANYCNIRKRFTTKHPIFDLDAKMKSKWNDIELSLSYLIKEGFLKNSLFWMENWICNRNKDNSIIIRYEDLIRKFKSTINLTYSFIHGKEIDKSTLDVCGNIFKLTKKEIEEKEDIVGFYPNGWTGRVNIWKDYMSEENIKEYKSIIDEFLKVGRELNKIYPNLLNVELT